MSKTKTGLGIVVILLWSAHIGTPLLRAIERADSWRIALFPPLAEVILGTRYARGYDEANFRKLSVQMSADDVHSAMGIDPLLVLVSTPKDVLEYPAKNLGSQEWAELAGRDEIETVAYAYTQSGALDSYILREVLFDRSGKVVEVVGMTYVD